MHILGTLYREMMIVKRQTYHLCRVSRSCNIPYSSYPSIRRQKDSHKFIELSIETPYLCREEGHKYGD